MRQHNLRILFFLLVLWGVAVACSRREARFRIGVSQCSEDEWRRQMNSEILREAHFYEDVEVDIRTAVDDNDRQAKDIRELIAEGVDLLIVAPNEATPITPVVEEAYNRGIPVIVVDRKILSDKYTAYVGADNYEIGKAVGEYVANVLHGQGDVVEISGLVGSTPAVDRHQGFVKAISDYPGIRLLAAEDGAWLQLKAGEKMDTLLSRFPHIDLVYAQNDRMAAGAYAAAARKGREKEMRFIGIDALPGKDYGVEKVLAGELDATFIYPTGGDRVMQIAMDILNKRDFPRETILGTSVVDRDNALIMKMQTAHIGTLDGKIETLNGKINQYLASYATQQVVLYGSLSALLLLVGLLVAVYLSLRAKNRLNRELSMQKKKLEEQKTQLIQQKELLEVQKSQLEQLSHELEEATHAKLVFFTNISHDFRTPLTLIADPIEQLLANRTLDGQRIQGYDGGADSYISKPFNSQLLLSRVRNLIANRRQLRQFFGDNQTIEKEAISDLDKGFVSRFKSLVEERMKDAELNVEDLGRNMGMSRVQLYRKLKSLTNYSPNELLRQMRLKKAASLLASSDMTVAEIAYEVGFSSPSYFTKCYKEQFGESPTEFLKRRG